MKTLSKIMATAAAVLMLFALLVGGIYGVFTDKVWVRKEYEKLDIESQTGWYAKHCAYVLGSMMDYSIGRLDTLEDIKRPPVNDESSPAFFNEDELSHMADVRALTLTVLRLGLAALIIGFALFAIVFFTERARGMTFFSKAFLIALGVLLLIVIALGIWMALDFDSFWEAFHHVFFAKQGNWTFDPRVSNMIRICPAQLFFDFIKRFALWTGIGLLVSVIMCVMNICIKKKEGRMVFNVPAGVFSCLALALYVGNIVTHDMTFGLIGSAALVTGSILMLITYKKHAENKPSANE